MATLIGPVVAPVGIAAVIMWSDLTLNVAPTPLKRTAVVPLKLEPLMVTKVDATKPLVGVKLVILGATVNTFWLEAVPPTLAT